MLSYVKKFAVDMFPSVAATVIGAYIVNHYIVSKPSADAPAAAVSAADLEEQRQGRSQIRDGRQISREHGRRQ